MYFCKKAKTEKNAKKCKKMIYVVYTMFIITCVKTFANIMSDVVRNGVISVPYVPQFRRRNLNDVILDLFGLDVPFYEWVSVHTDTLLLFKKYNDQRIVCGEPKKFVAKTLLIPFTSIAGHIFWHEWIITYDGSAYKINICRKERKGDGDKYVYNNCRIYGKYKYTIADAQLLISQFLPGTYIHGKIDIDMYDEIPAEVFDLFRICHIGDGHFYSRCAKLEKSYESYDCEENSMILLFKGFSEHDRFWSPNDKTDEIGANPILVVLLLAIYRMELSGNFRSISILDWLELLKHVCFSMFHY